VLALGVAFSVLTAVLIALRIALGEHVPALTLALSGSVSLLVAPSGLWLRRAVEGRLPPIDRALGCGVALASLPLALFASVLKSTTHHRPLGGATFAVVALGLLAFSLGLSFRIFRGGSHGPVKSSWQNAFTLGCGLSLGVALLLMGFGRSTRPNLLELAALAGAIAATGFVHVPPWLKKVRLPAVLVVWAALLTGALLSLREPEVVRSLTTRAPVSFAALSWLGGSF
jgi:hypothetical protein